MSKIPSFELLGHWQLHSLTQASIYDCHVRKRTFRMTSTFVSLNLYSLKARAWESCHESYESTLLLLLLFMLPGHHWGGHEVRYDHVSCKEDEWIALQLKFINIPEAIPFSYNHKVLQMTHHICSYVSDLMVLLQLLSFDCLCWKSFNSSLARVDVTSTTFLLQEVFSINDVVITNANGYVIWDQCSFKEPCSQCHNFVLTNYQNLTWSDIIIDYEELLL